MKPQISIIIPVYNSELYISRCLDSIFASTFQDFEIICINDGSTDNSANILKQYAKTHKNLKIINQENHGIAYTRNRGIKLATASYIMFIDNDDYITPNYIRAYYDQIKNTKYDLVIGGYRRIDSSGKVICTEKLNPNLPFSKYTIIAPWAKIYNKGFLMRKQIKFFSYPIGEDVYFNLQAYLHTSKIKIIDNTDYIWFCNNSSVSNTVHKTISQDTNLIPLLDKITSLPKYKKDAHIEYFFHRFIAWYIIYTAPNSAPQTLLNEYSKLQSWLATNNIHYRPPIFSKYSSGDHLKNKLAVTAIFTMGKLHLLPLFAKLYCKGGNR